MFNLTNVSAKPVCSTYQESYDMKLLLAKAVQFVDRHVGYVSIICDENGVGMKTLKGCLYGYSVENLLEKENLEIEQEMELWL